jgi:hypothetical protein
MDKVKNKAIIGDTAYKNILGLKISTGINLGKKCSTIKAWTKYIDNVFLPISAINPSLSRYLMAKNI